MNGLIKASAAAARLPALPNQRRKSQMIPMAAMPAIAAGSRAEKSKSPKSR